MVCAFICCISVLLLNSLPCYQRDRALVANFMLYPTWGAYRSSSRNSCLCLLWVPSKVSTALFSENSKKHLLPAFNFGDSIFWNPCSVSHCLAWKGYLHAEDHLVLKRIGKLVVMGILRYTPRSRAHIHYQLFTICRYTYADTIWEEPLVLHHMCWVPRER